MRKSRPPPGTIPTQPFSDDDLRWIKRAPQVKIIRRALRLTQEEFAERYAIPLGTLRDWEQGRSEPDQPAKAYLMVIASDPKALAPRWLEATAPPNVRQHHDALRRPRR